MNAPVLTYVYDLAPAPRFRDLDLVRVRSPVMTDEGEEVPAGTRGTVVAIWGGGAAYEVEFDGEHMSLATVGVDDLEHASAEA